MFEPEDECHGLELDGASEFQVEFPCLDSNVKEWHMRLPSPVGKRASGIKSNDGSESPPSEGDDSILHASHDWAADMWAHSPELDGAREDPPKQGNTPDGVDLLRKHCRQLKCEKHPSIAREQFLFAVQTAADCALVEVLHRNGFFLCAIVTIVIIFGQYLITWALTCIYVRTAANGRARYPNLVRWVLSSGPLGVLGLDALLLLDALLELAKLDDIDFNDLVDFVPAFRSSRLVFAAAFEALPLILLHAFAVLTQAHHALSDGQCAHVLFANAYDSTVAVVSILLAAYSAISSALRVRRAAQHASISIIAYVANILDIGAGLPLHPMYTNVIMCYSLPFEPEPNELFQLCAVLATNRSLNALNLSSRGVNDVNARQLARMVRHNWRLRLLWLGRNSIGDDGAIALADALARRGALTDLRLWDNDIGDDGASAFARTLTVNCSLTSLTLYGNCIADAGIVALSEALTRNATLTNLGLSANKVTNIGACAMARALHNNSTLRELNLAYNAIGDDGARALASCLYQNSAMQDLGLWYEPACAAVPKCSRLARARPVGHAISLRVARLLIHAFESCHFAARGIPAFASLFVCLSCCCHRDNAISGESEALVWKAWADTGRREKNLAI